MNRLTLLARVLTGGGAALLLGSGRYVLAAIVAAALLWTHSRTVAEERDRALAEAEALRQSHRNLATELAATRLAMRTYEERRSTREAEHQIRERGLENVPDDPRNTLDLAAPRSVVNLLRPASSDGL